MSEHDEKLRDLAFDAMSQVSYRKGDEEQTPAQREAHLDDLMRNADRVLEHRGGGEESSNKVAELIGELANALLTSMVVNHLGNGRWSVRLPFVEVKDGRALTSPPPGVGNGIEGACYDLLKQILGKRLVSHAEDQKSRREIVPTILGLAKIGGGE